MIWFERTEVMGWEAAIRGMRNPHNSWDKSDSKYLRQEDGNIIASRYEIGPNDHDLMMRLVKAGTDHRKFMRMIAVYVDVTAPLYWWKEFKTYRAGKRWGDEEPDAFVIPSDYLEYDIEMNSCSTMHSIHKKPFNAYDFSCEDLLTSNKLPAVFRTKSPVQALFDTIDTLNACRKLYLETGDKIWWRQMIQLLPDSYNQCRTLMLNYEVLANIYRARRNHKLTEWREFCRWIETLPYSELITGGAE
nr:MAG TPA: hypothetical protein [Bacteriophage sp.]